MGYLPALRIKSCIKHFSNSYIPVLSSPRFITTAAPCCTAVMPGVRCVFKHRDPWFKFKQYYIRRITHNMDRSYYY